MKLLTAVMLYEARKKKDQPNNAWFSKYQIVKNFLENNQPSKGEKIGNYFVYTL